MTNINSDLPYIVRVNQLFEIVGRHILQVPNRPQYSGNFLNGLVRQVIKMLLHGTAPGRSRVEPDFFHGDRLTYA